MHVTRHDKRAVNLLYKLISKSSTRLPALLLAWFRALREVVLVRVHG